MLSPEQLQALELLSSGHSQVSVANQLGVSRRTVVRWMSKPEFKQALTGLGSNQFVINEDAIEPEIIKPQKSRFSIRESLENLVPVVIREVESILTNPDTRTADKLRAAQLLGKWYGLEESPDSVETALHYLAEQGLAPGKILDFYIENIENIKKQLQIKLGECIDEVG